MTAESRYRLAFWPALEGWVPSAFHPMREAVAEPPELPLCAGDHGQRRDRPSRSGERPESRRNAGTRLPWRIAPRLALMSREVRRGLTSRLRILLLCGT